MPDQVLLQIIMEKEKFISIVSENRKLIYKICYSYCKKPDDRKDLEQEILLQLWKSFRKFDGRVKITTWMYRVALNTAISFYRNDYKRNGNCVPIDDSIISLPLLQEDPEVIENTSILYLLIEKLNEFDKSIILLYLDDNKYQVIAEILGISETNVATRISRIKKTLKDNFSKI